MSNVQKWTKNRLICTVDELFQMAEKHFFNYTFIIFTLYSYNIFIIFLTVFFQISHFEELDFVTKKELEEQNRKLRKLQRRFDEAKEQTDQIFKKVFDLKNNTLETITSEKDKKIHDIQVSVSSKKNNLIFFIKKLSKRRSI